MRWNSALFPLLLMVAASPLVGQSSPTASADEVAARAFETTAGPAWATARYISFTFNVERDGVIAASFPQKWDRFSGRYAVSGKDREGHQFRIVMNVNDRTGRAWVDGAEVTEVAPWLERGYGRFINDTYWLLMPTKMLDPGVHREMARVETDACGATWDVVRLSFEPGVGLTSSDQYWPWVNRDTGLVDRWDMLLQGAEPGEAPTPVKFRGWRRFGGLLISTVREFSGRLVRLDDVVVSDTVPAGAFD